MRTGWSCGHADVRGDRTPWTGVRPPTVRRPPARTRSGPCGSRRGHGNERGAQPDTRPEPLLPQATAAAKPGEHGRCPVSMATPAAPPGGQERTCRRPCRTLPLRPSGLPSRFRTPRTDCRVRCPTGGRGARGTGRRVGGHWLDAASAGARERAGRLGGRGAARGRRPSPGG
jgi:hypothetical protein